MSEIMFGFKPSKIDGTERIFNGDEKIELPEKYTYRPYLPKVIDQGERSICVPCTISAYLNWRENLKDGVTKDNHISLDEIYDSRTNSGEGMTYKTAFKFLSAISSANNFLFKIFFSAESLTLIFSPRKYF